MRLIWRQFIRRNESLDITMQPIAIVTSPGNRPVDFMEIYDEACHGELSSIKLYDCQSP